VRGSNTFSFFVFVGHHGFEFPVFGEFSAAAVHDLFAFLGVFQIDGGELADIACCPVSAWFLMGIALSRAPFVRAWSLSTRRWNRRFAPGGTA